METLYDVQQLFKQFGMYIYVGARIYDIELMMIELKKLYEGQLV
ncbi:YqgQ family protein, partial [Enterococcus faecalis]